jgi:hypothetical protein
VPAILLRVSRFASEEEESFAGAKGDKEVNEMPRGAKGDFALTWRVRPGDLSR